MQAREFFETSPRMAQPSDRGLPLVQAIHADVVIIRGGFTGLSTALLLRDAGVDVVLIENGHCGAGASVRNAGHAGALVEVSSIARAPDA